MPELPEVQTMVNDLNAVGLPGAVITDAKVYWDRIIANPTPKEFCRLMADRKVVSLFRRAKFLVFELSGDFYLIVHLRMTGRFEVVGNVGNPGPHVHVILGLDNQQCLLFHDTRKFGRFYLTRNPEKILGKLGPEPFDTQFSAKVLAHRLSRRHRQIKPLLLDQYFLAGLGNIYADEALWRAAIHPMRPASSLAPEEAKALHHAIRFVLRQGLRNGGTTLGKGQGNFQSARSGRGRNADHLKVYRRTGQPCPRCRRAIEKIVVSQRSTHLCNACQQI